MYDFDFVILDLTGDLLVFLELETGGSWGYCVGLVGFLVILLVLRI